MFDEFVQRPPQRALAQEARLCGLRMTTVSRRQSASTQHSDHAQAIGRYIARQQFKALQADNDNKLSEER